MSVRRPWNSRIDHLEHKRVIVSDYSPIPNEDTTICHVPHACHSLPRHMTIMSLYRLRRYRYPGPEHWSASRSLTEHMAQPSQRRSGTLLRLCRLATVRP